MPQALSPLIAISRDPIALVLLWQGFRRGLFRPHWLRHLWLFTSLALAVGGLISMFDNTVPLVVWAFGLRTNVLHLPLILIIPGLLTPNDLQRLLKRLLMLSLPIALLMLWQYRSPIDSWINRSALDGVMQIRATAGRVRPSGPFSFITGAAEYFALVNAVLLGGFLDRRFHPFWILYGLASSLLALSVSGSRLMQATVAIVWVGTVAVVLLRRGRLPSANVVLGSITIGLVLVLLINVSPLGGAIEEGWQTTGQRTRDANLEDGGLLIRLQRAISIPDTIIWEAPHFGYGLGLGTNYGKQVVTGSVGFALSESDIQRVMLESGLYIGGLFLVFRNLLSLHLASKAWWALARGLHLPTSLFFSAIIGLSFGQIHLPTSMGFLVIGMAFSLAATRREPVEIDLRTLPAPEALSTGGLPEVPTDPSDPYRPSGNHPAGAPSAGDNLGRLDSPPIAPHTSRA
ncbi:MAG: hypothetical protein ACKOXO_08225 [Cyanobium sp.]